MDFERVGLKDFDKSDMEWGRNFGCIDVEIFVFIEEGVVVGRIIWGG